MAGQILANLTISELYRRRQSKEKISIKDWIFSEIQKVFSYLHSGLDARKQVVMVNTANFNDDLAHIF